MLIKNEMMIKKIFDRVYGISYYGEHFADAKNMGIPYEFDANGKISELNNKIYNLKRKIAEESKGQDFDIDDYEHLNDLVALYETLLHEYCYKMFFYGFTLNPENSIQ